MSTFKTFLKIVKGHKFYFLIYLVIIGTLGLAFSGFHNVFNTDTGEVPYKPLAASIAVIDRDRSELSQSLTAYLSKDTTVISLEDSERAIQDAVATNRVDYILVIPKGWGESLMNAAQTGGKGFDLQTYVSFATGFGSIMDIKVKSYAQTMYAFAADDTSQNDVVRSTEKAFSEKAERSVIKQEAAPVSEALSTYLKFSTYPIFASIAIMLAVTLSQINRREIQERFLIAPETSRRRNLGIFLGSLIVGCMAWLYISVFGVAFYGRELLVHNPEALLASLLALLVFSFFATSFGFFVGQLKISENASNAIGTVMGLALSALGGGWISVEAFSETLQQAARFIPSYWMNDVISRVSAASSLTADSLEAIGMDMLIVFLFGVAFFCIALVVGRNKTKAEF